jgi:hypothetical protein
MPCRLHYEPARSSVRPETSARQMAEKHIAQPRLPVGFIYSIPLQICRIGQADRVSEPHGVDLRLCFRNLRSAPRPTVEPKADPPDPVERARARGDGPPHPHESERASGARSAARLSVRERAARALDDDWPDVLAALRRGLEDKDAGKAARTAVAYVQLVYGRQLQQPVDEQPADPLDVSQMTREQRNALKRRLLSQHPELVEELTR